MMPGGLLIDWTHMVTLSNHSRFVSTLFGEITWRQFQMAISKIHRNEITQAHKQLPKSLSQAVRRNNKDW